MMKALLRLRFQALFAGMLRQGRQKKKNSGKGMLILFVFLYLYVAVVLCGAMALMFWTLAEPYHAMGLDWLYFSMAGSMGLGFAVIGSVFTTQSQLYDAKDNDLLLSMPIPPAKILLSRMLPLLALSLLFAAIVMVPAAVVYAVVVRFSAALVLFQLLSLLAVTLLSQAIACVLGWLLHLLLSKINKSIASLFYMVVFLGLYFSIYPRMNEILTAMALNAGTIGQAMQTWVWPMFAMGRGCLGAVGYLAVFAAISAAAFFLMYWLLSATFLRTATSRKGSRRHRLELSRQKVGSAVNAIMRKELRRFLGCPVYLTNMGLGLVMIAALAVAGVLFRSSLLESLGPMLPMLQPYFSLIICGILSVTASMVLISTPSVSLEGKYLWVLKSMPVSAEQILRGKLDFHCLLSTPLMVLCGLILTITYGCPVEQILLTPLVPALLTVLSGLLGLVCDLKWTRLDWISEAYPCKQSISVMIVMFSMMGLPLLMAGCYFLLADLVSISVFLLLIAVILAAVCFWLYKVLMCWGVKKWNAL